jgi:plastocyanin
MRRALASGLAIAALIVGAAVADPEAERCAEAASAYKALTGKEAASEPDLVLMYKYRFCPAELKVRRGATVRYVNVDKRTSHSVWLRDDGREESERVFQEGVIEVSTIGLADGRHSVLCGPHWERDGMKAVIIVGD